MSDTETEPHLHPYSRDLAESLAKTLPRHLGMTAGRHGYWLYFTRDQHIGPSLEHYGEWAEVEHQLFRKIVKPGMIVLEAGSNIGTLTVPLAKLAGVEGRVHAFEPQRRLFQMLCANLALNGIGTVHACPVGLSDENTTMFLAPTDYSTFGNFAGLELQETGYETAEEVDIRTIDSYRLKRLDFLKIDVEGMEARVLGGSRETIGRCRPVIFIENDHADSAQDLAQILFEAGYRCWWHLSIPYNPHNFFAYEPDIWKGAAFSNNMVCLPRERCGGEMPGIVEGLAEVTEASKTWQIALDQTTRIVASAT